MGTRSAAKIKLRTAPYRCDVCGRRMMSAEALKTHQLCMHNINTKVKPKVAPPKQGVTKPKTQPQPQKMKNPKVDSIGVKPKIAPSKKIVVSGKPSNKISVKDIVKRRTKAVETCNEYECPKCTKTFPIYFLAHRHIQKSHCFNSRDEKVSPNSPDLIKPNVMLVCVKCNKRPKSLENHKCPPHATERDDKIPSPPFYLCMGCKQQFQSLRLFDLHVSGLHCDGVESMFFPTTEVFRSWKEDMMKQTGIKYYMLGNYSYKQMLRCPCVPEGNDYGDVEDIRSFLCPSCIVVQELPKGIQVHLYRHHYNHSCGPYVLPDQYKKYSLATLIENEEAYTKSDGLEIKEPDLYRQFKQLMECIILDAAKIKIDSLKILISKALDMTSVLDTYQEDSESELPLMKKTIQNNISGMLAEIDNDSGKRRISVTEKTKPEPITKRFKTRTYQNEDGTKVSAQVEDTSIKIINSFSLAEQDISKAINNGNENDFDLEDKICKVKPETGTTETQSSSDKEKDISNINDTAKELDGSPSSFAESYKDFVKQLTVVPQVKTKNKIKPNSLNKKQTVTPVSTKPQNIPKETKTLKPLVKPAKVEHSLSEVKLRPSEIPKPVDIKYEVKERENDCNILILKI